MFRIIVFKNSAIFLCEELNICRKDKEVEILI